MKTQEELLEIREENFKKTEASIKEKIEKHCRVVESQHQLLLQIVTEISGFVSGKMSLDLSLVTGGLISEALLSLDERIEKIEDKVNQATGAFGII